MVSILTHRHRRHPHHRRRRRRRRRPRTGVCVCVCVRVCMSVLVVNGGRRRRRRMGRGDLPSESVPRRLGLPPPPHHLLKSTVPAQLSGSHHNATPPCERKPRFRDRDLYARPSHHRKISLFLNRKIQPILVHSSELSE